MTDSSPDQPVQPLVDLSVADAETLVDMGVLEPQPEPEPHPES
ncbi:hypothetical protein GCM10010275_29820 [Streptomyces litmocidini]|nr:hypothetical protein [Streptomyces litmocidini]GGU90883.1 hypothetical protein GCM10010275_29820 [Streptomyces litmocidini]